MFGKKRIKAYFDNNIYNYLVDGRTISPADCDKILRAIKSKKLKVIFSGINFEEILGCFKSKPEKAKKMMAISNVISNRISPDIPDIINAQLLKFNIGIPLLDKIFLINKRTKYHDLRNRMNRSLKFKMHSSDYKIMECEKESFRVLVTEGIKGVKQELNNVYSQMRQKNGDFNRNSFNDFVKDWDIYKYFNNNAQTRRTFLIATSNRFFRCDDKLEKLNSFGDLQSLYIWFKVLFRYYKELIMGNSSSRPSDKNDIEQSIYYAFVDFVVTMDTGRHGAFPNYQKMINEVIKPFRKSVISFDELLGLL